MRRRSGAGSTKPVASIPIDGHAWSSITLTHDEAEAATWGERHAFLVVDHNTRRLARLWFSRCEARNRPSIIVSRRKRARAVVTLDLYCTDRCLTLAGWRAIVDAYGRYGSHAMARVENNGIAFADYVFGTVDWPEADRLARELLAITSAGLFVRICHRPPEEIAARWVPT